MQSQQITPESYASTARRTPGWYTVALRNATDMIASPYQRLAYISADARVIRGKWTHYIHSGSAELAWMAKNPFGGGVQQKEIVWWCTRVINFSGARVPVAEAYLQVEDVSRVYYWSYCLLIPYPDRHMNCNARFTAPEALNFPQRARLD